MSAPVRTREPGARGRALGVLVVVACVLACTLPIIVGLLAGTFVDRVLHSPAWIALVVGVGVAVAIVVIRRRGRSDPNGC